MAVPILSYDIENGVIKRYEIGHHTGAANLTHKAYLDVKQANHGILSSFRLTPQRRFRVTPVVIGGKKECQYSNPL